MWVNDVSFLTYVVCNSFMLTFTHISSLVQASWLRKATTCNRDAWCAPVDSTTTLKTWVYHKERRPNRSACICMVSTTNTHEVITKKQSVNHAALQIIVSVYAFSSGLLKTYVRLHLPQYCRSKCDAMNTPAPQSSLGHSRRRRVILPFSSTWTIS